MLIIGGFFFLMVFLGILGPVPTTQQLQQVNTPIASEVFSADGKVLGRYYVENRSYAAFDEISEHVVHALISAEDARFYEHRGIDEIALLRVFVKSILMFDRSAGGGSTLSQQIAKNLFPRVDYGPFSMPVNKLREAIIAYRLEKIYSKQEILAMYLNTVPFAENIYGIEVASERFFSKRPSALTVDEAAVLVGMLKANNYYNPRTHPERAKERRDLVIDQMVKYEYLTREEAAHFKSLPLNIRYRVITYNQGPAPYFLEMLRPQLLEWCSNNQKPNGDPWNLYTDGLKITTTLDYNLQQYANQAVAEYLKNLQTVFDHHWEGRDLFREDPEILESALKNSSGYQEMRKSGLSHEEIVKQYGETIKTSVFTWDGIREMQMTRLDSLKHYLKFLQTGLLAVDPSTGEIKAWVGGIDFRYFKYDHVLAQRQTGSAFKPFVYLSALENGVDPGRYFENTLKTWPEYQDWTPRNSHDEYGGYYTMKGALSRSLNTVSVEVLMEAGITGTIRLARDLGIEADLPDYPSLALGVASVSLKEMTEAYAGIVNEGRPVTSWYLTEISDSEGNVLERFESPAPEEPKVSPENCRTLIHMLEAAVNEGTGKAIRTVYHIEGDFAGKTGTTQNNSDGWFIGLTPGLVTACWVGADDPRIHFRTTNYGQGAYMALPVVAKFFYKTYRDKRYSHLKYKTFTDPEPELLVLLDKPDYSELPVTERRPFDFASIFGKKKEEKPELKTWEKTPEDPSDKEPVWEKIRRIFRKK